MQTPEWLKPGIWGGVIGAVAITIVGFSADWVTTTGSAQEMAENRAEEAVAQALTPICVARFKELSQEKEAKQLAALEEEGSYGADEYVAEQGWATMPGAESANDDVADACADELMKLAEK